MKLFHISDLLSVTTGYLVSNRHIDGVYDVLNFLTGDDLYTHQLPRASDECKPWLASQFPQLMKTAPEMEAKLADLNGRLGRIRGQGSDEDVVRRECAAWVEEVRAVYGLPEMIPVYEMPRGEHIHIDPVEEMKAMVGDDRVIPVVADSKE